VPVCVQSYDHPYNEGVASRASRIDEYHFKNLPPRQSSHKRVVKHAVRACAKRGIRNLVYSHFAYAKRERDNLTHFKERNGFKRVDLPRYCVPITTWGQAALRLGLHHRFADRLPEDMGEKLGDLRSMWNNRSNQSARASI
jgi:hypothetical protein